MTILDTIGCKQTFLQADGAIHCSNPYAISWTTSLKGLAIAVHPTPGRHKIAIPMLNLHQDSSAQAHTALQQWVCHTLQVPFHQVGVQIQPTQLDIFLQNYPCPPVEHILSQLTEGWATAQKNRQLPAETAAVMRILLYGDRVGGTEPPSNQPNYAWKLEVAVKPSYRDTSAHRRSPRPTAGAPFARAAGAHQAQRTSSLLDNEQFSQARQGHLEAIAAFVQTGFAQLGVRVHVTARWKALPTANRTTSSSSPQRLVLVCTAKTSPDPGLVAEAVVRHLRSLGGINIEGSPATARDAIVQYHAKIATRGSTAIGWTLWVDLRPAVEILQTWAYWGDGEAIARLLDRSAPSEGWQISGELKDTTLHLFVSQIKPDGACPPVQTTLQWILPVLQKLAPTGIQSATIYGAPGGTDSTSPESATPAWVHYANLPRGDRRCATEQARQGNLSALEFLLERLLTPNLDTKLATGGVRVRCRWRQQLLHVMVDAPTCPARDRVAQAVGEYVSALEFPNLSGLRIYGRRSGMRSPAWKYRWDSTTRKQPTTSDTSTGLSARPTPVENAPTSAVSPKTEPTPETSKKEKAPPKTPEPSATTKPSPGWMARLFLATGLLLPPSISPSKLGIILASILGVLIAYQADRWLGVLVPTASQENANQALQSANTTGNNSQPISANTTANPSTTLRENSDDGGMDFSEINLSGESQQQQEVFNRSQFTQKKSPTWSKRSVCHPDFWPNQPVSSDCKPTVPLDYPTFNAEQVDRKLALYKRYLQQFGTPDVLLVGSSRALRGVDPAILHSELAQQGYEDVDVFNMAVNGATAQVVDFMIRELLPVAYVPDLIVWADGTRAFNSGREDITYNAIAASGGYQKLSTTGKRPIPSPEPKTTPDQPPLRQGSAQAGEFIEFSLDTSAQEVNQWLQQYLADTSHTYNQRKEILTYLQNKYRQAYTALVLPEWQEALPTPTPEPEDPTSTIATNQFDFTGFLPLDVRFNPETYYKNHPKVSGKYDRDYQDFSLNGKQQQATQNLLDYTEKHDIKLVFVNLPLTEQYLDPVRSAYGKQFKQHMLRLAMERDFHFRDLSQLWPNKYKHFSDPSHLNRYGAYRVSQELAADPMIRWLGNE